MESIVVSAKYKGETSYQFTHGQDYMIAVSQDAGRVVLHKLKSVGDKFNAVPGSTSYDSVLTFLVSWEEISSFPTIPIVQ